MKGHIRKRETKNGPTWQIVLEHGVDENGKRIRTYKAVNGTKKDAEKIMVQMLNELQNGTLIEESKITVAQYLRDWLKTYVEPNLSPTSIDGYRKNVEKHIIPYIGNVQLQQLKPMHIQKMYRVLQEEGRTDGKGGLAPRSIRYVHENLRKALEQATKMQMISRNVADLVDIPKVKAYHASVYDEDKIIELLEKAKGTDLEVPVTIAAALGLRRGETLGLKWDDINFEDKKVIIRNNLVPTNNGLVFKTPKTDTSSRTLDLSDSLITILRKHQKHQLENRLRLGEAYQKHDLVCSYADGSPINPGNFSKKFAYFLLKNGLEHIRFHDLRHSNATLMLKYGIQPKVASERLGHSSIGITLDLYSHVIGNMQKEVADKIENGILSKLSVSSS